MFAQVRDYSDVVIVDSTKVPFNDVRSVMHILIADREADNVRLKEMIKLEGNLKLTPDMDTCLRQTETPISRKLGQFFDNKALERLNLDLLSSIETYINNYRSWSWFAICFSFGVLFIGLLWVIKVQKQIEDGKITDTEQDKVWRWSTILGVCAVAVLHSLIVYYQGGLLVSPIGLVATAIVPLLLVQVIELWESLAKSWPLVLPLLVLIIGHWCAHVLANGLSDSPEAIFLSNRFSDLYLYQFIYILSVILGILSIRMKTGKVKNSIKNMPSDNMSVNQEDAECVRE